MEAEPSHGTGTGTGWCGGCSRASWPLAKARVAAALAVLRSRPPGVGGREHGEALGRRARRQQEAWRERALALQQEVLRLRQEQLVSRATAAATDGADGPDDSLMEDMSQDLFGPPPDSGSETPDLLLEAPPPLAPPPPAPASCRPRGPPGSDALLPHMRFLECLCSLQRLDGSGRALEAECRTPDGSAAAETLLLLLDSLAAAREDPPVPGPPDMLQRACRAASRALDVLWSEKRPPAEVTRRVEEVLMELTQGLLHSRHSSWAVEPLKEALLALGGGVRRPFMVRLLLSEVCAVVQRLWQVSQAAGSCGLRAFPMDRYQNSCHLLWVLEQLLLDLEAEPVRARRRPEAEPDSEPEAAAFLRLLELRLPVLAEEFPLFSVSMWRVGKLLAGRPGSLQGSGSEDGSAFFL